jgi:hypothetical protein
MKAFHGKIGAQNDSEPPLKEKVFLYFEQFLANLALKF